MEPRVLAAVWIPFGEATLCLDCEVCYETGTSACPHCGSRSAVLLSRFLRERPGAGAPSTVPDRLISFRAAEDRVGNGLSPARLYAKKLIGVMEELRRRCGGRDVGTQMLADISATWAAMILEQIDDAMARLRALWKEEHHENHREDHHLGRSRSSVGAPGAVAPRAHDSGDGAR